jgi:oligosaccharyltransferase complex subunit beta
MNEKVKVKDTLVDSGNFDFVSQLTQWVFQEKSVLMVKNAKHHRVNETEQHGIYRIKDQMVIVFYLW